MDVDLFLNETKVSTGALRVNIGQIYNPLALLELCYSPLFTQHISYILMSNMSNRVQKILLVFIDSNLMYVEHVRQTYFFVQ